MSVRPTLRSLCADPKSLPDAGGGYRSGASRFEDNGHYVGHDEPAVRFISTASGSADTMTYFIQLPRSGTATDYAELSSAPWFAIPLCDPNSFPASPGSPAACAPASDSNIPTAAGSAVMELQFYPPKYGPFVDGISCDATRWCAALNVDSLECDGSFSCNGNCTEPANFAYLTFDGHPTGPPSPQQSNLHTMVPNSDTLMLNEGDTIRVTIQDTGSGVLTRVDDFTIGQSGFMVASGANGFMNTDPGTCAGAPFDFRAEYNTASVNNVVPWAALNLGVTTAQEVGHFEACSTITNQESSSQTNFPSGFSDSAVWQTCNGPSEVQSGSTGTGEGPCTPSGCSGVGEGGTACSSAQCELSDAYCLPGVGRSVTVNGVHQTWIWPRAGCVDAQFQNGDLDYDGTSYQAEWPDGNSTHPTSVKYLGPFDPHGVLYTQVQFETNVPLTESNCNPTPPTNAGCTLPPTAPSGGGSVFYPYWSSETSDQIAGVNPTVSNPCIWNFGDISGTNITDFGKLAQYGSIIHGLASATPQANPPSGCPSLTLAAADPATALRMLPASGNHVQFTQFAVTVFAVDAAGFVPAAGFTDTVGFSSSDGAASLPSNDTFTPGDRGIHAFVVTLRTLGFQTVSIHDVNNSGVAAATGSFGVEQTQQDVFWQDGAGHLEEIWYVGGSWHGPLDLTAAFFRGAAPLQSAPSAEMLPDGSQQLVFWQGPGSHLFEAWYAGGAWHGPLDLTATFLSGVPLLSAPSAQVLPDGSQQLVFWRGSSGGVDEAWYAGGTWHGPLNLSGAFLGGAPSQSAPSAQVLTDGSQQLIFWQDPGDHAEEAWYANGIWHGPLDLTGAFLGEAAPLQSSPSATLLPDDSQQLLFWDGPGGGLNEAWYAGGGWHGPLDLTGAFLGGVAPLQSAPSATVLPDATQQLAFWQGPGNHLFEAWYAGGGWRGPVDWTATLNAPGLASAPSAAIEPVF